LKTNEAFLLRLYNVIIVTLVFVIACDLCLFICIMFQWTLSVNTDIIKRLWLIRYLSWFTSRQTLLCLYSTEFNYNDWLCANLL